MEPNEREQVIQLYKFGSFLLDTKDTTDYRLLYEGQPIKLQDKQFSLLCVLVRNHGRALSNDELIRELWPENCVEPQNQSRMANKQRVANLRNIQKQISLLRRKVGGKALIATPKKGWHSFIADVVEIESPPVLPDVYAELKFDKWIFHHREGRRIMLFLGAGITLALLYLIFYIFIKWSDPRIILSLIQTAVIGWAYLASSSIFDRGGKEFRSSSKPEPLIMRACGYDNPTKWNDAKDWAKDALKQYIPYWKFLLASWGCLYLFLTGTSYLQSLGSQGNLFNILSVCVTLFNNCNSLAITLCYVVLSDPTVFREADKNPNPIKLIKAIKKVGAIAIALFLMVEVLLIFVFFPSNASLIIWVADVLSGLAGGVTLALFVGRIQSRFLGPSLLLPLALYLYVVIQSLYVFINKDITGGTLMIGGALILKCLLYLYMAWLFKSGRLLFYLLRVRPLYERVNVEWKEFLFNLDKAK